MDKLTHPISAVSMFIDLATTDEAGKEGVYAEALSYATNNKRVFNIALTGPYGSGKSSIIKSFLKRYPRPAALSISLAAFVPGVDAERRDGAEISSTMHRRTGKAAGPNFSTPA